MTPDKRLDQIEPVLADVAQKTDRLIESNGQILEVAIRADSNAEIAAKGVADLTIKVNLLAEGQDGLRNIAVGLRNKTNLLMEGQADLQNKTNQLTKGQADLQNKATQLAKGQIGLHGKIDLIADDQVKLRQEMNQKFAHMEKTQQQILTLLLDRLS